MWMIMLLLGSKLVDGAGQNRPTVQSALDGGYYVRATPAEADGDRGTTEVFRVGTDKDELLDSYPTYLHGELLLGWSPLGAGWCVVQLEPVRTTDPSAATVGALSSLAFHCGGRQVRVWSADALRGLGLDRRVTTLIHEQVGQFLVHGIEQVPGTNQYVLRIEHVSASGGRVNTTFDITTGAVVP